MGQQIEVADSLVVDDVAVFTTDRSVTGQDGSFGEEGLPGELAARLREADAEVEHVFVASNQIVVRRQGGWDAGALEAASGIIGGFFVFYR